MINILGQEIDIDPGLVATPLFCRLDLKASRLRMYRLQVGGRFELIKGLHFPVKNIEYY